MCLRTKMKTAKKAGRQIHCYKLLYFDKERNLFTSPVTKTVYGRDEVLYETRFRETLPRIQGTPWANVIRGFHSYMSMGGICIFGQTIKPDNLEMLDMLYGLAGVVVARCVIPYGALYWVGNGGGDGSDEYDQYCSDRIELAAYLDPETGEWRRPGRACDEAAEPAVNILRGLTITEAKERLGRWYVLESQEVYCDSGVYRFRRAGTYGRLELRTWRNRVMSVI